MFTITREIIICPSFMQGLKLQARDDMWSEYAAEDYLRAFRQHAQDTGWWIFRAKITTSKQTSVQSMNMPFKDALLLYKYAKTAKKYDDMYVPQRTLRADHSNAESRKKTDEAWEQFCGIWNRHATRHQRNNHLKWYQRAWRGLYNLVPTTIRAWLGST